MVASLGKEFGGSTRANLDIVSALRSFGLRLDLHVVGQSNHSFQEIPASDLASGEEMGENVLFSSGKDNPYGLTGIRNLFRLYRSTQNYDTVVVSQFYGLHSVITWLSIRNLKSSLVLIPHGTLTKFHESEKVLKKKIFNIIVGNRILNRVNLVVTTTEMEQSDLSQSLRVRSVVIPLPFNIETWQPLNRGNKPRRILCVGRLTSKKRIDLAVKAFAAIKPDFPSLKMVIVGDGPKPMKKKLLELIDSLNMTNDVEFRGWLSGDNLKFEYYQNQILLHLSESENFSIVIPEAVSTGNPVVTNDKVGISWLVQKHKMGLVITDLEVHSISASLRKMLEASWDEMRKTGPFAVQEELSPLKIASQWHIVFDVLAKERSVV